ncbi:MAG: hypothetical protein AAFO15_02210, partial [Pseudomonadota bacterium]
MLSKKDRVMFKNKYLNKSVELPSDNRIRRTMKKTGSAGFIGLISEVFEIPQHVFLKTGVSILKEDTQLNQIYENFNNTQFEESNNEDKNEESNNEDKNEESNNENKSEGGQNEIPIDDGSHKS